MHATLSFFLFCQIHVKIKSPFMCKFEHLSWNIDKFKFHVLCTFSELLSYCSNFMKSRKQIWRSVQNPRKMWCLNSHMILGQPPLKFHEKRRVCNCRSFDLPVLIIHDTASLLAWILTIVPTNLGPHSLMDIMTKPQLQVSYVFIVGYDLVGKLHVKDLIFWPTTCCF